MCSSHYGMNWTMAWITVRPTTLLGMFLMTLLTTHLTAQIEALLMAQIMARAHDVDYSANKDIDEANDADDDNAVDGVNDSTTVPLRNAVIDTRIELRAI